MNRLQLRSVAIGIFFVILIVVVVLNFQRITDITALREWLSQFGIFAPVVFGLIYILVGISGLPMSAMTVVSGALFGLTTSYFIVITAGAIAASIAFGIGRYFSAALESYLQNERIKRWYEALNEKAEKTHFGRY